MNGSFTLLVGLSVPSFDRNGGLSALPALFQHHLRWLLRRFSPESSRECRMMSQSPHITPPPSFHPSTPLYRRRRRRRRWVGPKCILLLRHGATQCGRWIRSLFKFVTAFTGERFMSYLLSPRFVFCLRLK